jgi:lysophospholipase L1-like esterase
MPTVQATTSTLTRAEWAKPGVARRVLGALISVAVTVLSLELAVRLVADNGMQLDLEMWKYARDVKVVSDNPRIAHKHRPNRRATLMGVDVQTNSRGLRDREFSFERTPDTRRIVMLGDSITAGWGVPVDQTFSKRIERLYGERGINAEVINTGVGNWNTVQEVEFFLTEAYQYRPDIVVLTYFVNDAEAVPKSQPPSFLARHCYSCTFMLGRMDSLLRQMATRQEWSDYYLTLYQDGKSPTWLAAKDALKRLADYCQAHDVKLLVAMVPELHDVKQYRFERVTQLVREAAAENGAGFVDLLPYLSQQDSAALWVTPPDPHPNAFANQLIATGLFHALEAHD